MNKYTINPNNKTLREIFENISGDELHILFNPGFYISGCSDIDTLHIKAKKIILEGIDNVIIYDNKGHMINSHPKENQPSSLAHTILLEAEDILINNITFVNGCNIDYEYNGIKYKKVSNTITQAYAFGAWNCKKLEVNNSSFYSVLDTLTMRNVDLSIFNNCYIQGNNDFLPHAKKSYMTNCIVKNLGPYPVWSTDKLAVYDNVIFNIDESVNEFSFTKRGGNLCFIDCKFNTKLDAISFEIEPKRESRYYLYNTNININCYNESLIYLKEDDCMKIRNHQIDSLSIDICGDRILDKELILKTDAYDSINISNDLLYKKNNDNIIITSNIIGNDKECYVELKKDFIVNRYYFNVIGIKLNNPTIIKELTYEIKDSKLFIDYEIFENNDIYDKSYVEVYQDNNLLYKIHKNQFINLYQTDINKSYTLIPYYQASDSKLIIGNKIVTRIINNNDIKNELIIDSFKGYELNSTNHLYMKHIQPLYLGDECPNFVRFNINENELPFIYSYGTDNAKGIEGLLYNSRGASLIYPIKKKVNSFELDLNLAVEKSSGEGFGSANGQYLELYINYDINTHSGIAVRLEREASTTKAVEMSIREYINGYNKKISDKLLTKNYLTDCHLQAIYKNNELKFILSFKDNIDELSISIDNINSMFMLRSTGTVGIGNRFLIKSLKYKFA